MTMEGAHAAASTKAGARRRMFRATMTKRSHAGGQSRSSQSPGPTSGTRLPAHLMYCYASPPNQTSARYRAMKRANHSEPSIDTVGRREFVGRTVAAGAALLVPGAAAASAPAAAARGQAPASRQDTLFEKTIAELALE